MRGHTHIALAAGVRSRLVKLDSSTAAMQYDVGGLGTRLTCEDWTRACRLHEEAGSRATEERRACVGDDATNWQGNNNGSSQLVDLGWLSAWPRPSSRVRRGVESSPARVVCRWSRVGCMVTDGCWQLSSHCTGPHRPGQPRVHPSGRTWNQKQPGIERAETRCQDIPMW